MYISGGARRFLYGRRGRRSVVEHRQLWHREIVDGDADSPLAR
jgi:hypothetical protein